MWDVLGCITVDHDLRLVGLAGLICFLASVTAIELEAIDLGEAVEEAMRLVTPQAKEGQLTLGLRIAPDVPFVSGDRRRLRQVLVNLLSNAVKFTPAGGRVMVTATTTGEGVSIAVSDTGIGMRAEDIPTALDRFGQIDSRHCAPLRGHGAWPTARQGAYGIARWHAFDRERDRRGHHRHGFAAPAADGFSAAKNGGGRPRRVFAIRTVSKVLVPHFYVPETLLRLGRITIVLTLA